MENLIRRLAQIPTAPISDIMRRAGMGTGTMHSSMKPVWDGAEVCGPAFTVHTYPGATAGCDLALQHAKPGDVVVVAAGGITEVIVWGEIYSAWAKQNGLGGTVIDGAARDIGGIREIGYPLFARAVTPGGATADDTQSQLQIPVACAGVVVQPGDLVRGDENGVVVIPAGNAAEVVERAEALARKEARMVELLRAGVDPPDAARQCVEEGL